MFQIYSRSQEPQGSLHSRSRVYLAVVTVKLPWSSPSWGLLDRKPSVPFWSWRKYGHRIGQRSDMLEESYLCMWQMNLQSHKNEIFLLFLNFCKSKFTVLWSIQDFQVLSRTQTLGTKGWWKSFELNRVKILNKHKRGYFICIEHSHSYTSKRKILSQWTFNTYTLDILIAVFFLCGHKR